MTSQVILGNGHGIALASDSAVTMGHRRTYETSEKIYPLPRPHSVAVLHAGNVMFHGMPFSTIIDSWIENLGELQFRFLRDYVENFRKFLVEEVSGWCDLEQQSLDYVRNMDGEFQRIWNRLSENGVAVSAEDALLIWKSEVDTLGKLDRYGQFSIGESHDFAEKTQFERVWSQQTGGVDGIGNRIEYWFDDVPRSTEIDDLIKKFVQLSISSRYPLSQENYALLTFAGFGARSMIPAAMRLEMHGALNDSIQWDQSEPNYAMRDGGGFLLIELMGQTDAIATFLRGYDVQLIETIKSVSSGAFDDPTQTNEVDDELGQDALSQTFMSARNKLGEIIEGAFDSFGERNNLRSFRSTVAGMPLASLAATVKSLIQIQELSLESRGYLPTVGGQVRVATITKSHGFKWVNAVEQH